MSKKESFFRGILDSLYDGVYFVDMNRRITYWNKGAERITGYASSEAVGISCSDSLLVHIDDNGVDLCKAGCPLAQTLTDGRERETEAYLQHKDGHRLPVSIRVSPLRDASGRIVGAVETFSDNSSKAALLQRIDQLQKESLVDPLTGLANRRCIDMKLHSRIDEMQRYGWPCGVLFLDIDNFKIVNDSYGHNVGDGVLMMVARTLANNLRAHDTEFGTIRVTVSIGATVVRPEDTIETAITRADLFMYNSKIGGRNRVSIDTMLKQNGQDLIRKGWSASGPVNREITASRIQFQSLGKIEPAQLPKKRTFRKK